MKNTKQKQVFNCLLIIKLLLLAAMFKISFALALTPPVQSITPQNYCTFTNLNLNLWMGNPLNDREEVKTLQNFLFTYYGVDDEIIPTGYFGRITKSYVTRFQKEHKLFPITGGLGPLTRSKIKSLCNLVGGDEDQYGCKASAGYTWCALKNKCIRTWEESCQDKDEGSGGSNCKIYFDGCNTCGREYPGGPAACTLMACVNPTRPYCKEYFNKSNPSKPKNCTKEYNPVCGQPKWSCPEGQFCATVMPAPKTYSNLCNLEADGASLLYQGFCK